MTDIRSKALDRFDPGIKRIGHVADRRGKMPDLILPLGKVRNFLTVFYTMADTIGGGGETAQRIGDGRCQE